MTLKYEQIMDKIEVTPEMRQRVLRNVEAETIFFKCYSNFSKSCFHIFR